MPQVHQLLQPLTPHWDRIVRSPLSKRDVTEIERRVGLKAPPPLRDWLLEVGLIQDLTHGVDSTIEFFQDQQDFVDNREFLRSMHLVGPADLFPFGDDGAGNLFALSAAEVDDPFIYLADHETRKVSRQKRFLLWLEKAIQRALKGIKHRPRNDRKVWCVQFTFDDVPFAKLLSTIGQVVPVKLQGSRWKHVQTIRGMTESTRQIQLGETPVTLTRLESPSWKAPNISFDMDEPIAKLVKSSTIRKLNALFKLQFAGYKLVNYGPLDRDELEDQ